MPSSLIIIVNPCINDLYLTVLLLILSLNCNCNLIFNTSNGAVIKRAMNPLKAPAIASSLIFIL